MGISVSISGIDVIDSGRFHILPDMSSAIINVDGMIINVEIERVDGPHKNPIKHNEDGSVSVVIRPDSMVSVTMTDGVIAQIMISMSPMFDRKSGANFLEYTAFRHEVDK